MRTLFDNKKFEVGTLQEDIFDQMYFVFKMVRHLSYVSGLTNDERVKVLCHTEHKHRPSETFVPPVTKNRTKKTKLNKTRQHSPINQKIQHKT